jgi:hypothetical protein
MRMRKLGAPMMIKDKRQPLELPPVIAARSEPRPMPRLLATPASMFAKYEDTYIAE